MHELILHHYPGSPYAEKIRAILGYKRLSWRSVEISEVMPRPRLMPLTGGHRRSPVLQIGADVFCDTRCIAFALEARAPEPTLFPEGSRALSTLLSNWAEPRVFLSAGVTRLQTLEDVAGVFGGRVTAEAFVADRTPFMQPALEVSRAAELLPTARDQVRIFLGVLGELLDDGRAFLAGPHPSLADFSAYHTAWWLQCEPRIGDLLDEIPAIAPWARRIAALGHGDPEPVSAEAALESAREAVPSAHEVVDPFDPAGRKPGDVVRVSSDDYGCDEVTGRLVALDRDSVSVLRDDPEVGSVVVHFPRIGFRVLPVPDTAG